METALNLLWLGVALSALTAWRFRWSRRTGAGRGGESGSLPQSARFGALCCALVLLFFVISVSDDLQQATGLIEDTAPRGSPYKSKFSRTGCQPVNPAPADAARGLGFLLLGPRESSGSISSYENFELRPVTRLSFEGRAPPISTL